MGLAAEGPQAIANISGAISERNVDDGSSREETQVEVLVERAQQGDKSAFGEIYEHFFKPISRLTSFYLGGGSEDATAETFLRAWSSLSRYKPQRAPLAGWLYGIARHVVADELKRRKRAEPFADVPDSGIETSRDDALVLAAAIEKLPSDQRRIIEMKYFLGMKNPEVARAMKKSIGAVNAQQWRALRALEKWVDQ